MCHGHRQALVLGAIGTLRGLELEDDVSRLQTSFIGRGTGSDLLDGVTAYHDTQERPPDLAVLSPVPHDSLDHGHREGEAVAAPAVRQHERVDADHQSLVVQQRSARVTLKHVGVDLKENLGGVGHLPVDRAEDAPADRPRQSPRVPDGVDVLRDLEVVLTGEPEHPVVVLPLELLWVLELDDGHVGHVVGLDDLCLVELRLAVQGHLDASRVRDDVVVGEDRVLVNEETGTHAAGLIGADSLLCEDEDDTLFLG